MDNESIYLPDNFTSFLALSQQERDLLIKEEINKLSIIYIHTSPSGKSYIGQTCRTGNIRWSEHKISAKMGAKTKFARALRKYNKFHWNHGILWVSDCEDETNQMEQYLIEKFDTIKNGYNIRSGGDGGRHSEEYRLAKCGLNHWGSIPVNIFDIDGNKLAESVSIPEWCRENPKYHQSGLHHTLYADFSKPSSCSNVHFYKGICARHTTQCAPDFSTRNANNSRAKLANVYNKHDILIDSSVNLHEWCKLHGCDVSSLYRTAHADRTKPSTARNLHFHKGIRAEYV